MVVGGLDRPASEAGGGQSERSACRTCSSGILSFSLLVAPCRPSPSMSFTQAQRQWAVGLYKRLLRVSGQTFQGDAATASAWRLQVRDKFQAASKETDPAKIEEGLKTWEDVVSVLRHNVVQGEYKTDRDAYQLKFTKETELGSNESVKLGRQMQMEQLHARQGVPSCGGASSSSSSSSSPNPSSARRFSTSSMSQARRASSHLPRPVPQFPQTTLLSDGSSIQLTTTSPRSMLRLTRDPTNHPLWNPSMERKGGAGDEDESGRLGRFRRRFGGTDEAAGASSGARGDTAKEATESQDQFGAKDLEWMSVGGREARPGTPMSKSKKK